jgi:hypothetical protein
VTLAGRAVGGTTFAFFVAFRAQADSTGDVLGLSVAGLAYAAGTAITLYAAAHVHRRASASTAAFLDRLSGILLTAIAVTILASGATRLGRRRPRGSRPLTGGVCAPARPGPGTGAVSAAPRAGTPRAAGVQGAPDAQPAGSAAADTQGCTSCRDTTCNPRSWISARTPCRCASSMTSPRMIVSGGASARTMSGNALRVRSDRCPATLNS